MKGRPGRENRRDGPLRGIGISFAYQGNGFLSGGGDPHSYAVEATLEKDGTLELRTSAVSGSRETAALWKRIAAAAATGPITSENNDMAAKIRNDA